MIFHRCEVVDIATGLASHPQPLPSSRSRTCSSVFQFTLKPSGAQFTKLATRPDEHETVLIALVDGRLAGICLLVLHEFEPLHDVSPWLASLYVAPEYRKRGVTRRLVAAIEDQARSNGVARLHLYTGDAEEFYLKCGWSLAEQGIADGEPYAFMIRDL